ERRNLAEVRRGEYEGLRERLTESSGRPDAGPATFNPRSGACIIGARRPLIAFNVNLGTTDLDIAQRIARAVRHSSGGFRAVKAMGVELKELNVVQVSMNLTDYTQTPIHRVVEAIRSEAARYGVPVVGSELVGLAPLEALDEVVRYYLQLHDFSSAKIIESHLL
ncbi:MAG: glutamate formimidoyltransferase, partial [Actinobacteria bacterium]|nr:glutamate formimidoyltransferase [Actinomycetota bacterium]